MSILYRFVFDFDVFVFRNKNYEEIDKNDKQKEKTIKLCRRYFVPHNLIYNQLVHSKCLVFHTFTILNENTYKLEDKIIHYSNGLSITKKIN